MNEKKYSAYTLKEFIIEKWYIILYFVFLGIMVFIVLSHDNKNYDDSFISKGSEDFSSDWNYYIDESHNGTISLPADLPNIKTREVTYTNTLPENINEKYSLFYRVRHTAVIIYINDEVRVDTYSNRDFEHNFYNDIVGVYYQEIPLTNADGGKEIKIVTYTNQQRYITHPGSIYYGERGSLFLSIISSKWNTLLCTILLFFLAVMLVILWMMYGLIMKTNIRELLCLGLFSASVGLWLFTECDLLQFSTSDTGQYSLLAYEILMLMPVPIAMFFIFYSDRKIGRQASIVASLIPLVVFAINNLLNLFGIAHLSETMILSQIMLGVETFTIAIIQVREIAYKFNIKEKYDNLTWKIPLIGISFIVPLSLIEIIKYIFFSTKYPNDGILISFGVVIYLASLAFDSILKISYRADKFRESSEVKSAFLANMSHEIRTPLNAILGFNEVILRISKEEKVIKYSHDIQEAGENLKSIINSVLDISRIESGKLEIYSVEYNSVAMLDHIVSMFDALAKKKGLDFIADIDPKIPEYLIGDDSHIIQVLTNILSNAVKYTKHGSITFSVKLIKLYDNAPLCSLRFSVKDTGLGIKDEDLKKLFQKFERFDREANIGTEGTGLGMSIVASLLQSMDSEIHVKSEYGVGSEFYFDISQTVTNTQEIGDFIQRRLSLSLEHANENDFIAPNARILIVDDVQMNIEAARALLENLQLRIDTANSGFDAIERIQSTHYDLVLMDHMMPKMDGIEATQRIRNLAEYTGDVYYATLPIIALTANAMTGMKENFLQNGMQDFVSKPIELTTLYAVLKKWLPHDLIVPVNGANLNMGTSDVITSDVDPWSDIPDFVDVNSAKSFCPKYELFEKLTMTFLDTAKANMETIVAFKDEKNEEEYKVAVHGLKSASKTIGLMDLSNLALNHERLCQTNEATKAFADTNHLIDMYQKNVDALSDFMALKHPQLDNTNSISLDEYRDLILKIKKASDSFNMGAFMTIEDELRSINPPNDKKGEFETIKTMVTNAEFGDLSTLLKDFY